MRVIVPDFGSGYGGKHTGETAVEAARIAKAAGKPVMLRWTREEEFKWAAFRPAGVIDCEASFDSERQALVVVAFEHQFGQRLDGVPLRDWQQAVAIGERAAAAPAARLLSRPGRDGEHVRPRVVHG